MNEQGFSNRDLDIMAKENPVVTVFVMLASFALLSISMKTLPLGTAYVVWTGIGAVGAFVVGVVALGEPLTLPRVVALALIVAGLALMKLTASA